MIENDVKNVEGYIAGFAETQSEMCVPLIIFGEKLGVLALDSAALNAFDNDDVQPLESVADICARASRCEISSPGPLCGGRPNPQPALL